jgi:hypothetical protein
VDEGTLRKIQALATIGSGIVALHGVTSKRWQLTHTVFVALGLGASLGLVLLPRLPASEVGAAN